jgi:hypothetical protein
MKIIQETENVLGFKKSAVGQIIFGAIFVVIAGVFAVKTPLKGQSLLILGIFGIVGIALILFAKISIITFDKGLDKLVIAKKGLLGGGTQDAALSNISQIEIVEEWRTETVRTGNTSSRVPKRYETINLVLKDGSRMALDKAQAGSGFRISGMSMGPDKEQILAKKIADFLNVPLNRISPTGGGGAPPVIIS